MQTVAETRHYMVMAEKLLTAVERQGVVDLVAADPECGTIVSGTGGIRKVRFGKGGKGKSGGVRIVYYYHSARVPLLLITLFAKNDKDNLSKKERNDLSQFIDEIKKAIRRNYD